MIGMFHALKRVSRIFRNEGLLSAGSSGRSVKVTPVCGIHLYQRVFHEKYTTDAVPNKLKTENHFDAGATLNADTTEKEYENDIKNKILKTSLNYVPTHGWTKAAIVAGAQSIGYPGVVSEMFPLGGGDLVLYFYSVCNAQLREYLKSRPEAEAQKLDKQDFVKKFVSDAIETRLRMIIPYIEKWPQALAMLTLSRAIPTTLSNLLTLVDDICYYAGDRSVDFDWYVRRIALAGVYKATELYMLQDKSIDYENTWKFLKTQLDDAAAVYSCIQQSEQASQLTKEISQATFVTARNILGLNGLNWKR